MHELGDSALTLQAANRSWLRQAAALVQVRARLVIVLVAIGLVVGYWDVIAGQWNWVLRLANLLPERHSAVSPDTEFFCPMDPGVISPWEDECPICYMALVRRKKGEAILLPDGVVARMQVSPERLQLAGVKTVLVDFRPLEHEIVALGLVRESSTTDQTKTIVVSVSREDVRFIAMGQVAEVRSSVAEAAPARGKLAAIGEIDSAAGSVRAEIALDSPGPAWQPGALATAVFRTPLADLEPYRSLSREPPPLRKGELRVAYISREHPEVLRDRPGRCPLDGSELIATPLIDNQRLDYWCPMHPEVFSPEDGHECAKCNGMKLLPRIVSYARPGQVLAVPASAVIDTGRQQLVYVEVAPGMLEAWPVKLGSRAGGFYPVLSGLQAGDRAVTAGAMLLDAETRLSGQASTAYFGAATAAAKPGP
jgi:hypothetical protein